MKPRGGSAPWWNSSMDSTPATPRSTSSKYKGVVPQPNGRWGAQIYENHQRLWLGTFDTEPAAARSYDMAAMRLRGTDADLNFKSEEDEHNNNDGEEEDEFLSNAPKFQVKRRVPINEGENQEEDGRRHKDEGLTREPMFEKPLTPSDVGKLNRLVIPKQYAERYFPINGESGEKGLQLSFEDEGGKIWRFRYSYWNSSQSYVLTKGWSRYVKEKKLDAGDIVSFHRRDEKLYISWRRRNAGDGFSGLGSGGGGQMQGSVPPSFGQWGPLFYSLRSAYPAHPPPAPAYVRGDQYDGLLHAGQPLAEVSPAVNSKRLRLFGVNLDCPMDLPETITPNGPAYWTQRPAHASSLFYTGSSSHNP